MTIKAKLKAASRVVVALGASCALIPASASAAAPELTVRTQQSDFATVGERMQLLVAIENSGEAPTSGAITVSDTVTPGLRLPEMNEGLIRGSSSLTGESPICETTGFRLSCLMPAGDVLPPKAVLIVVFETEIEAAATGTLTNVIAVSGGGSPSVHTTHQITVGEPGAFDFDSFSAAFDGLQSPATLQAASDPKDFTTSLHFKTTEGQFAGVLPIIAAVQHFKNVVVHLPAGLVGNLTSAPQCTIDQLTDKYSNTTEEPSCPAGSQIGIVHVEGGGQPFVVGLYNMVPPPGFAAEFGFVVAALPITLDSYVRPGDGGVDIVSRNTTTTIAIIAAEVTVWGDPASHVHDPVRGGGCLQGIGANGKICESHTPEAAFLRLPTSCSGAGLPFGAASNTYEDPGKEVTASFTGPAMTGCERVPFNPSIDLQPTTSSASSASGVAVRLSMPQTVNPEGLWEADLKKAVVTLPEGMTINPSSADGLQACTDAQLRIGLAGPSQCPETSKIGRLELRTPLLENPIEGSIWLRTQNSSDPASGEMFRVALEFNDERHGIDIKVPGQIAANPVTGQLTSTFDGAPQLPFEDLTLHFKAGARSPLRTPASCGTTTSVADLYSWAQPDVAVRRNVALEITSGPEGSPCASPSPFNPGFDAGVSSVQAGGYTPFLATFKRSDADQSMQRVSVKMPEGLLGSLVGIPLCGEAQANAGTCSQASEIGSVTAGAGAGPTPFYVTGGHVYMTGPYEGAPFGLSVVVPAKAGPFDLGTVVVRAKVEVDVHTAQLTITTDPLPQIVGGVPVNLRLVNVTINRPDFTYNPTNCNPTSVSGTMTGGQGAVAALSNHFQVTNCGALGFKPKFSVSTSGKTSRANGASLDAKLSYPKNLGQANIAKVKVALPKQLPSRLTTLQKACLAQTFEANPAACPSASRIGNAVATTPVLPVPLSGPVYFVSHGGEAFPDLVVVLQGYGVTVDLVGTTFISKAGITSTTFKTVPDVPVGTFELKLPQGRFSALAANGNLCNAKLKMPTAFLAQDGTEVHQTTTIAVTGCAKHKTKKASKTQHKGPERKNGKKK